MTSNILTKQKSTAKLSFKAQTLATVCAVALAVALPQVLHAVGAATGAGTALGEIFLPMHLPVLAVGFMAGPLAGAVSGALAPVVSFALSGMPGAVMLPVMCCELFAYGLIAGLLSGKNISAFRKLLSAQLAGRIVRAVAVFTAVYAFDSSIAVSTVWMSTVTGFAGILLQWAILPSFIKRTAKR